MVGETTGGGANPTRLADLDHGFFALIPFGRAVDPVTQTDWEGQGVSPDLAVPAEQALARAHRVALEGLKTHVQDLRERARLEGFALRLELANADLAGQRIANTHLKGVYAPAFPAPSVTVEERTGKLLLRLSGAPDAVLVPVAGNRYRLDGFPDGFFATFPRPRRPPQLSSGTTWQCLGLHQAIGAEGLRIAFRITRGRRFLIGLGRGPLGCCLKGCLGAEPARAARFRFSPVAVSVG